SVSSGIRLRSVVQRSPLLRARCFSSSDSQRVGGGRRSSVVRTGRTLPWLASNKVKEAKRLGKVTTNETSSSSWAESAKRLELDKVSGSSSWGESPKIVEKKSMARAARSTREESVVTNNRDRMLSTGNSWQNDNIERLGSLEDEKEEDGEEEEGVIDDPRWYKIKNRFEEIVDVKAGYEKPEVRRWNKQETWGKRTWKETTESTVPKMVGEGVYGVGPVLAALSAGRREFYALYVQEGLDLSSNSRKKKDKKGFEKVLKMAEKIGLSIKEASKHDLNMVVDNRPHQGLVLDASPLEMVKIKELNPASVEEDKGSLWVALDEVMDPQNLGAIIRSAYFFGASGVVLCAKNSAPLSGVVSKASAGSLELMELRYCKNMMQFLTSSAENGWRVIGGSVYSKAVTLNEITPGAPTILVLGSEGTGLRPLVERSCTQLVRIPGNIPLDVTAVGVDDGETTEVNCGCSVKEFRSFLAVESLNVSVAAGVLLHHLIGSNYND
ncbi:SpoU_methylase domain-containing protein/SpoU_sub_bind domain-containing protein, partial [Cephalotus follicularis]